VQISGYKNIAVVISANSEWRETLSVLKPRSVQRSPYGDLFFIETDPEYSKYIMFFHGGVGKISAAGSAQYIIDKFAPELLVNIGTCGGFEGSVDRGDIILADETVVYDIYDSMEGGETTLNRHITKIPAGRWKELFKDEVIVHKLVSADRDLVPSEIEGLKDKFGAIAGDWESGAIAYIARKNSVDLLILRGVSDIVSRHGGEAYGDVEKFHDGAAAVMAKLIRMLFKAFSLPDLRV